MHQSRHHSHPLSQEIVNKGKDEIFEDFRSKDFGKAVEVG
jgi:hypothetical protein